MDQIDKPVEAVQGSPESRRRLLRGMAAVGAGAGIPGLAMAGNRPYCQKGGSNYHASASAVGSMVGSNVGTDTPKWGYKCTHYKSQSNWNFSGTCNSYTVNWNTCGNTAGNPRVKYCSLFGVSQTAQTGRDCADILQNDNASNEAYWLCALFNAMKVGSNFPYTPQEVVSLCQGNNPWGGSPTGISAKALTLFKDYLSAV